MKKSSNHKKGVMVGVIAALVLVVALGVTFAIYNYSKVGDNQILVTGDIYMKYTGTNQINATDMLPIDINNYYGKATLNTNMTEEELYSCENYFNETLQGVLFLEEGETAKAFCEGTGTITRQYTFQQALDYNLFEGLSVPFVNLEELKNRNIIKQDTSKIKENIPYFEFTVEGVNNYSKDIWYEIVLKDGDPPADEPTRTERLRDDFLRFRLVEVVGEEEQEIFTNRGYEDISNERIYVNTISANTKEKVTKTYRIYMWISDSVKVGVGDNIDYDMETWNNEVYASVKINVAGDFVEKDVDNVTPVSCFMTQEFDNNGKTEIMITDYDTSCGSDVVIPREINGYEVTVIGKGDLSFENNDEYIQTMAFSQYDAGKSFCNKGLTSVIIPNTVRIIGYMAFALNNLTKVEIPDSVEWIGEGAFVDNSLHEVIFSDKIKYIGREAFGTYIRFFVGKSSVIGKIQIKKSCEEIKNIPASPTDLEEKYYPFVYSIGQDGLDIYGYEDGAYKLCEHLTRNSY